MWLVVARRGEGGGQRWAPFGEGLLLDVDPLLFKRRHVWGASVLGEGVCTRGQESGGVDMRCRLTMSLVVFSNGQPKQWMDGSLRARTRLSVRPRSNGSGAPGSARLSGGLETEEGSGWLD